MVKKLLAALTVLGTGLALAGCGGDPLADPDAGPPPDAATVVVGSANFPENQLLAEIYAQALEGAGVPVTRKFGIGSRELYLRAIQDGSISLIPEYTGALLTTLAEEPPAGVTDPEGVYRALQTVLPPGLSTLAPSAAQSKPTLTVTAATAQRYGLSSIEDLAPVDGQLRVAAGPEFAERQQGLIGLRSLYGLEFADFVPLGAGGPLTLNALTTDQVQVANIFTTNSAIATEGLVVLDDPRGVFTAQNVLPLIREEKATDQVRATLDGVSRVLTTENLTRYLAMVTVDRTDNATVAKAFIAEQGLR